MLIIFPDVIDQAELYNNYSKTISHRPTQTHTDICPSDALGQIQSSAGGGQNISIFCC